MVKNLLPLALVTICLLVSMLTASSSGAASAASPGIGPEAAWEQPYGSPATTAGGPAQDPGLIAYVRRAPHEIRLIQPDGTGDRSLWVSPQPDSVDGILSLNWRPDGSMLAFSSDHESGCSWYDADVYTILPNGRGLRRVSNAPRCASLANYPQGAVRVDVFDPSGGLVWVYVMGSSELKMLTLAPGGSATLTFEHVADLGPGILQPAVGIWGHYRYLAPIAPDVLAGQTVGGPSILFMSGNAISNLGIGKVTWRSDGAQIGYAMRNCLGTAQIPLYPPDGAQGTDLPKAEGLWPCRLDLAPPADQAGQFLYSVDFDNSDDSGEGVYLASAADPSGGTRLFSEADFRGRFNFYGTAGIHDLEWLPDGSGFLLITTYIMVEPDDPDAPCMGTCSDVFAYDFQTATLTQVTRFHDDTARGLSLSPDGQQMVVQRIAGDVVHPTSSLWVVGLDGTNLHLLVDNAWAAAWGPTPPSLKEVYLPLGIR
jgi:hypothetical protein